MLAQEALDRVGHRDLRRQRRGRRVLAGFDADDACLAVRLFGRDHPWRPTAVRLDLPRAALDHMDLGAGRIDADAEAGEIAIPEDGVLAFDGEAVDDAFGESDFTIQGLHLPDSSTIRENDFRGPRASSFCCFS